MKALSTVIVVIGLLGATNAGIIDWNAVFKFVGNSASYILSGAEVGQDYSNPRYRPTPSPNSSLASDRERL